MTISIDPIIFRLGPFEIRWYGVFITTAIVVGFAITARDAKRRGFNPQDIWMSMIWTVIGGLIGARLVHVFDNLSYYIQNPGRLFGFQVIGLAIYGALAGGAGAFVLYMRHRKLPALKLLDCGAVAMPIAQVVGKFANLINGDTWGSPTELPWGIIYTNPNTMLPNDLLGVPTHPAPIYEQLWLLLTAAVVWRVRPRLRGDGQAIILYIILYSIGRFFISFLRVNNPIFLGLKQAQLLALGVIIVLGPLFIWLGRRGARDAVAATAAGTGGSLGMQGGRKTERGPAAAAGASAKTGQRTGTAKPPTAAGGAKPRGPSGKKRKKR
ncbi:MAG: prolipoprotein diacylglyceryl transferase [Actinobacteria bacterium]|nr:prolipoprotein diacylglyceryl transferase [Actinomycetota bacterium]